MPDANARISNLRQATADYVAEYNLCKCKPCHNGGTLTLLDGKCICMCTNLYEGLGCQNFKGDKIRNRGKTDSGDVRQIPTSKLNLPRCVKNWKMFLQMRDRLLTRKVTGPAGVPGQAAAGGDAPGHATATRTGLLELRAEEAQQAKNTARRINDHSPTNLYLSNKPMRKKKKKTRIKRFKVMHIFGFTWRADPS